MKANSWCQQDDDAAGLHPRQTEVSYLLFKIFFPFIMLLSVSVWRKWRFSENDRQGWGELRSPLRSTNSWVESTRVRIQLYHLKGIMWAERRGQKLHETPFSPKTIVSWRKDDFFSPAQTSLRTCLRACLFSSLWILPERSQLTF